MNELTELWHALLCIANGNFIEMEGLAPSSEHSIDIHHSSFCQDVIITVGSGTAGGNLACNQLCALVQVSVVRYCVAVRGCVLSADLY